MSLLSPGRASPGRRRRNETPTPRLLARYLASIGETNYALALLGLIIPQVHPAPRPDHGPALVPVAARRARLGSGGCLTAPPWQIYLQFTTFLKDPIKNDVAYQAKAQPFLVFGILTTALACGHHTWT